MRCVEDVENFPMKFDALPNFGNLEIEITVDDPKAYHKAWTVTVKQRILLNEEMIEFICIDKDAVHYVGGQK